MTHGIKTALATEALRLVGCYGTVVGPVMFRGVRFWASVQLDDAEVARRQDDNLAEPSDPLERRVAGGVPVLALVGCLVSERTPARSLQTASLLASYARRSIVVDETADLMQVAVDAALLDQGVVVQRADGQLAVIATPGPAVASGEPDARELALLEAVYAVWRTADGADAAGARVRSTR